MDHEWCDITHVVLFGQKYNLIAQKQLVTDSQKAIKIILFVILYYNIRIISILYL